MSAESDIHIAGRRPVSKGVRMKMFRLSPFLIPVVCCITNAAFGQELKQYLNIRAPETALNAPLVLSYQGETTLVGLYDRNGQRDVSALRFEDGKWLPLGKNGNAITGVGGNFISDFVLDSNGTPWLLTYYTRPSNPNRADRFFLYTLRDDEWVVVGPPNGHKADYSGRSILFFLDNSPVLSYGSWDKVLKSEIPRLFVMRDNRWIEKAAGGIIPRGAEIQRHRHQPFVVRPQQSRLEIFRLVDIDSKALGKPQFVIHLPANYTLGSVYFYHGKPAVLRLYNDDADSWLIFKCSQAGNEFELQELPKADDRLLIGFCWTPKDKLLIATYDFERARVYELRDATRWKLISSARESSGAVLYEPYFSVLHDGTAVVTWEAFFPH